MAELELRDRLAMSWVTKDQEYRLWRMQQEVIIGGTDDAARLGDEAGRRGYAYADAVLAVRAQLHKRPSQPVELCCLSRHRSQFIPADIFCCSLVEGHLGVHIDSIALISWD